MNVGWQELIVVFVILLLLFGSRMPEIGRSLGKGIKSFKDGLSGAVGADEAEDKKDEYAEPKQAASADDDRQETAAKRAGEDAGEEPPQGEHLAG